MTTDLPAGRELDALVAEKVMDDPVDRQIVDEHGFEIILCRSHLVLPRYSTDIAAAWTVVEKLDTDLWLIQVTRKTGMNEMSLRWWVELRSLKDLARDPFEVAGDTAPLAICRAALKAVEGKP